MTMMKLSTTSAFLLALLNLQAVVASPGFDCHKVVDDRVSWDLSKLGGPHSVHWVHALKPSVRNFTFTVDLCQPLKRTKGVPKSEECPTGTQICGVETITEDGHNETTIGQVVPIAGNFHGSDGKPLDSVPTRLKYSDSHEDAEKEGVRVSFSGGSYDGKDQKAVIEFLCDPERTGLEGDEQDDRPKDDGDDDEGKRRAKRADENEDNSDKGDQDNSKKSLRFISYKDEGIKGEVWSVLRLEWKTKYACEKVELDEPSKTKSGMGFFAWFFIILFVGTAAYLVMGSWMNYSRYGARGWDLLPHGDTIRDIPYLMKDWARRVVSTVQGGGSRGGYSAVS